MRPPFFLAAAIAIVPCCTLSPGVHGIFVAPSSLDELAGTSYLDHPWPSDFRRDSDGSIRVAGIYNPRANIIVDAYAAVTHGLLDGFSPTAAAYFRFDGDIDPGTLPQVPTDSLSMGASLQLVDVDPTSPNRGQRKLIEWYWQSAPGVYWLPHTLAVIPAHGYPLRPRTRYALVVTGRVLAADGSTLRPSPDLSEVLGMQPPTPRTQAVRDAFAPTVAALESVGLHRTNIVQMTVFTTNDPTAELYRVADDVRVSLPEPPQALASSWQRAETTPIYDVYQGVYGPSPNYQAGDINTGFDQQGGNFAFDGRGKPVLQNTFTMRFTLVIPNQSACPPRADGYPIVMYAHGTGGNYRSIVDEGNSVGDALARQCLASMGTDQIFHGTRPGAPPPGDPNAEGTIELRFFNLNNPIAARTNGRQGAVDVVQQARLFTETHLTIPVTDATGNALSRTGQEIKFDASRLLFFGHSQGGVNGPLFMAADKSVRGGVLSGTGGMITVALLEKTKPTPSVAGLVRALLGLSSSDDAGELNNFHPVINLAQMIVDSTDPINYMPAIIQHPRPGLAPKSIYQTEGIGPDGVGDSYAPPHGIEYASVAMGLPRQLPGVRPIVEASWGGILDANVPADGLSGNLAGGLASGVLAQFPPAPPPSDGHFVVFDVPQCRLQAATFCRNLAADPRGRVPAVQ